RVEDYLESPWVAPGELLKVSDLLQALTVFRVPADSHDGLLDRIEVVSDLGIELLLDLRIVLRADPPAKHHQFFFLCRGEFGLPFVLRFALGQLSDLGLILLLQLGLAILSFLFPLLAGSVQSLLDVWILVGVFSLGLFLFFLLGRWFGFIWLYRLRFGVFLFFVVEAGEYG